jgi:hypothetical protein
MMSAPSKTTTVEPTVDADHGRSETRPATVSTDIGWLQDDHRWHGLTAIGKVVRIRETAAKPHRDGLLPARQRIVSRSPQ